MSNQSAPKAEISVTHPCLLKTEAKHSFNFQLTLRISLIFITTFLVFSSIYFAHESD